MDQTYESKTLPATKEIRERIENLRSYPHRYALKFQYITGARVSEVCGKYAITPNDITITNYNQQEIVLFNVKTAKRNGKIRILALPLDKKYEPFTQDLVEYFERKKNNKKIFNFTPRTLQNYGKKIFKKLHYQIEAYHIKNNKIPLHWRGLTTHGLRHIRATELMMYYGFDNIDLTVFMGWSFKASFGPTIGASVDRYIYMQWSRYFPKLLKPIL